MNIYELAKEANVSIATVSKVINGKPDIGKDTRSKVLKIIEKNNYKPKVSVVNIRNFAVFAPFGNDNHISNPYFSSILSGIGDVAFDHDFSISLISTLRIPRDEHDFLKFCQQRKIEGGIFMLSTLDDHYIENFAEKLPLVVVSSQFDKAPIVTVEADNYSGGYEAVKHLIDYGHMNIMFIVPSMKYHDHLMRLEGGEKALEESGLVKHAGSLDDSLSLSDTDLRHHLKNIMNSDSRPTAIFGLNDQEAIRVMKLLQGLGMVIPEDISIVGFDDLYFAAYTTPSLTTVYQPTYEIGKEAGRMLINIIRKKEKQEKLTILLKSTKLMIRNSTRKLT